MDGRMLQVDETGEMPRVRVQGRWTLADLGSAAGALERDVALLAGRGGLAWDLGGLVVLDSVGALVLWRGWGRQLPDALLDSDGHREVFRRIAAAGAEEALAPPRRLASDPVVALGRAGFALGRQAVDMVALVGRIALDAGHLLRHPGDLPAKEISANIYKSAVRAMPVTALVGFLIGVVLSYLSALQLSSVGADVFIVNILGIGIIRELGPVLVSVLVAGRSGSAMTAQLGVMRVTEEIDALAAMGVSRTLRLILPKVVAMAFAMPMLVLWTSAIALIGGMISANVQIDISYGFFVDQLPKTVPLANVWIALCKGVVFGVIVALVACHFGLRVRPNTESLSTNTTSSVVTAITAVILADAIFAIATREIGVP
jgi:phospholipid/cholesterol/gamma-HCH transport system permease protein